MSDIRHDLPRGHWITTRDPWEVTERDRAAVAKALPGDEDDASADVRRARVLHTICWVITGWGGPLLDGKPIEPDEIDNLPLPLSSAIINANNGFWQEVRGEGPTVTP